MTARLISTTYFIPGKNPKTIRSCDANRAIGSCVLHMQINHYGATAAEVYDENGELHAVVKRYMDGRVLMTPKHDLAKYETKYSLAHLLSLDQPKRKR